MQCSEARSLIEAGVEPGSTEAHRAALGFHLGRCAACRAYRRGEGDAGLLAELLGVTEASPPPPEPTPPVLRPQRPPPPRLRRAKPAPFWRIPLIIVLAMLALSLGLVAGRVARAAYTIRGNLAAMQVTTAPLPSPTIALPAATPALSVPMPADQANPTVVVIPATSVPPTPVSSPIGAGVATPDEAQQRADALATADAELPLPVSAAALAATPTPIRLPSLGGAAPIPTMMPTIGVAPMGGEPVNILLLGSDRRPGEGWQSRSDAIMIVRLEPANQRVALLSFPRDLIVSIPGVGFYRINSATVYGEMYPQLGGGIELARRTVSDLIGIPIHHVVRTDFGAFTAAVDAIGGIEIEVERELYDPAYPTIDYGYMVAHFLPGRQKMDGATALIYSRLRHADSDYARARRQQQVMQAIMQRVRDENMLGQVQMFADLTGALRNDVQTDLSFDQMLGMAWAFRNFTPSNVERYTLDENLTYVGLPGDQYAITARPGAINLVRGQLLGQ
ncbi:MAG: LCP family protein [Oscillochloridaceae bacterium umkhey_bin13]